MALTSRSPRRPAGRRYGYADVDFDALRPLPLGEVLERLFGAELSRRSREAHASRLYIAAGHKIGISPGTAGPAEVWFDNSTGAHGVGAIDLVRHLRRCDARAAAAELSAAFHGAAARPRPPPPRDSGGDEPLPLPPPPCAAAWPRVRAYLTHVRGLPQSLIDDANRAGLVYADQRGNAVFPRARGGAFLRGTDVLRAWKSTTGRASCGPWCLPGAGAVHLVEAPIDGLAVRAVDPSAHVVATGGNVVAVAALAPFLPPGRQVFAAFDGDAAGERFAAQALALYGAERRAPPGGRKDWADAVRRHPNLIAGCWLSRHAPDEPSSSSYQFGRPQERER